MRLAFAVEWDAYLHALYAVTRHEKVTCTPEGLEDLKKNGIALELAFAAIKHQHGLTTPQEAGESHG